MTTIGLAQCKSGKNFFIDSIFFPDTVCLQETHFAYVHMEVREVPLKILFKICSEASATNSLSIESYSVSQNNLDNVFISFVREQNESAVQANGRGASAMPCAVAEDPSSRKSSKWELTHKKASSWQEGIPSTHSTDMHNHSRPISNSVSEILRWFVYRWLACIHMDEVVPRRDDRGGCWRNSFGGH